MARNILTGWYGDPDPRDDPQLGGFDQPEVYGMDDEEEEEEDK